MKRFLLTLTAVLLLLSLTAGAFAETWYVYTKNGKTLNLRSEYNDAVIGNIPYGTALTPDEKKSTEKAAYVTYNGVSGFVKWAYLQRTKPPARSKTSKATPTPMPTPKPTPVAEGLKAYFEGFAPAVKKGTLKEDAVLYWMPSEDAPKVITFHAPAEVLVLAENDVWSQVYSEEYTVCGFILTKWITVVE